MSPFTSNRKLPTISLLCINHQLKCCNPAVVIFSLHRRFRRCDFEALAHCSCPDSHFSTYAFWHDSLLPVSRHLLTIDLTRATHCPVIAPVVNTVIILTIDRESSSGRHTRHRHLPVDRQQRHPARYLRRLFSPDFTERRTSKTPSIITASSTTSRRLRVQPAPHHRLFVSALFTASLASSIHVVRYSSSVAIAGLSRARLLATDIKNYGHIGHSTSISFRASFISAMSFT